MRVYVTSYHMAGGFVRSIVFLTYEALNRVGARSRNDLESSARQDV